ncbi:hypothetical protein N8I77_007505 [Diaporthe amygdali]|uniref:Heterokaryon incompatibility domain-containing protein n=1 Tax=Phomopsis amygdali TaxID=1214568 RepID=A0AAD9SBU2_PHOAM|nr:hypothetical protein N8I77_007505 [Diaporthe amygdali]
MRLLNTTTFELVSNSPSVFGQEGYAILSHRWMGSEITSEQLGRHIDALQAAGTIPLESPQQDKIRGACQTARAKGIKWMWVDTCCIDKSSTAELSESLNSMFRWYRDAKLCITYLSDVIRKGALEPARRTSSTKQDIPPYGSPVAGHCRSSPHADTSLML